MSNHAVLPTPFVRRGSRRLAFRPEFVGQLDQVDEVVCGGGLYNISVRAKDIGLVHVSFCSRGTENDRGNDSALRVVTKPFEDMEPAHAGHLKVEQKQIRKWKFFAIEKITFSLQVVDR